MPEKMLKFIDIDHKNPSKRSEIERKNDFDEIYAEFIHENANKQSSRWKSHAQTCKRRWHTT